MPILGLGHDLIEIERIQQSLHSFGLRFTHRILTLEERQNSDKIQSIAAIFAAKEALVKALGTGFTQGISFQDINISHLPTGQPQLKLSGQAEIQAACLGVKNIYISLTHTKHYASAVVILES